MECEYGCGQEAKHQFKNGKWCCSKSVNSCKLMKLKNSNANRGKIIYKETRLKMRNSRLGKKDSKETRERKSISRKGEKNPMYGKIHPLRKTANDIINEHPFFAMIEEIRDDPETNDVQVRCKLNTCSRWFTPTYDQIRYRIYALENTNGNDGLFFYCSDECKNKCSVYNIKPSRIINNTEKLYTQAEYQTFRRFVLERDEYICQFCGEPAKHVHHERPQKLEPFFSLDPDFAWSSCEVCHYEKGHPAGSECSTKKIGLEVCNG